MHKRLHTATPFLSLLLLATALLMSGCATLLSGTDENISFDSEPAGADIIIDDIVVGQTPATVEVDRKAFEDADVIMRLDGYEDRRFEMDKEFNTTSLLNIFIPAGFLVDALTGALFKYDKKEYTVDLEDGAVTLRLNELLRGEQGQYIVPDLGEPIIVTDDETGLHVMIK